MNADNQVGPPPLNLRQSPKSCFPAWSKPKSPILDSQMEEIKFKHREQDHSIPFSREISTVPPTGLADRHTKTATAPPTGSPTLAPKPGYRHRPEDDILVQPLTQSRYPEAPRPSSPPALPSHSCGDPVQCPSQYFYDLPMEIHETIVDHLVGPLESVGILSDPSTRNWSKAMRHPRRKQMSDLALVSRAWKSLIQKRVYRHSGLS